MYRSWKNLVIQHPDDLRNPQRIRKLLNGGGESIPIIAIIAFAGAGFGALFAIYPYYDLARRGPVRIWESLIAISFIIGFSSVMFGSVWLMLKLRGTNYLRRYLRQPELFEFAHGKITNARYRRSNRSFWSRMNIVGHGKTTSGKHLVFSDDFSLKAWPQTDEEAGIHPFLPLKVHLLYQKDRPTEASLVGIDIAEYQKIKFGNRL